MQRSSSSLKNSGLKRENTGNSSSHEAVGNDNLAAWRYPKLAQAHKTRFGKGGDIPPEAWVFFHELQMLEAAEKSTYEPDITNAIWGLGVFVSAAKNDEDRRSLAVAASFIRGLPPEEHQAWYIKCQRNDRYDFIVSAYPDKGNLIQKRAEASKTPAGIGIILLDFQHLWASLEAWQRDFMYKLVRENVKLSFSTAEEVLELFRLETFTFLLARQLNKVKSGSHAMQLLLANPINMSPAISIGPDAVKHSYYELYSQLAKDGSQKEATGVLEHLVRIEAYSDESFVSFLQQEDLKNVVNFMVNFFSEARRVYAGSGRVTDRRPPTSKKCCAFSFFSSSKPKKHWEPSKLLTTKMPHILLRNLQLHYKPADAKTDKAFQQALEVILLLNESELVVHVGEGDEHEMHHLLMAPVHFRLQDATAQFLRFSLLEWTRWYLLPLLHKNRPPAYNHEERKAVRLLSRDELWTWDSSERKTFFESGARQSDEIALLLWKLFEVSMTVDPTIIALLLALGSSTIQCPIIDTFMPNKSLLFRVVAKEVSKQLKKLGENEIKLMMRSPGFFDAAVQHFLKGTSSDGVERARQVFSWSMGFVHLMQAVMRLCAYRPGSMDGPSLEVCISQIVSACQGSSACVQLMAHMIDALRAKKDSDFFPEAGENGDSSVQAQKKSAFTLDDLVRCARKLRAAVESIRDQSVRLTFAKVIHAFVEMPARGWVPLFNSLETVLFFLRFIGREDLKLAYEKFEKENKETFKDDPTIQNLLLEAQAMYKAPLINMKKNITNLTNLDVTAKLQERKSKKKDVFQSGMFTSGDWDVVIDIAACAAECMKEKYSIPMLPHHTQLIALLIFAIQVCKGPGATSLPRTILGRVGTGEGKSWIIGMLSAFVAKKGLKAHVVIDNQTLLERDYAAMSAFFKKLNIKVTKGEAALKEQHQVVYCSAMDIEFHFLAHMRDKGAEVDFRNSVMIVDEVDSLIVDENVYQSYVYEDVAGLDVCEWWWREGKNEDKNSHEPWIKKIMEKMEAAQAEAKTKVQDKHFHVDEANKTIYALDEKTSAVKRSAWFLWLELLRLQRYPDYEMKYSSRQMVVCQKVCFTSYSFIFGLTGSLGTPAEQAYTQRHFNASCFFVPPFLDTCRNSARPKPKCILTFAGKSDSEQLIKTTAVVKEHIMNVPILVVVRDSDRLHKVVKALQVALPVHATGDKLGSGVIELLDRPGKEAEFQKAVDATTIPLGTDGGRVWRVAVTTAVGARGQDYQISDDSVDDKGGFLLVLEYIPDSEREWIQFLGRTARHDHPGQYALVLNASEYSSALSSEDVLENSGVDLEKKILDHTNMVSEGKLQEADVQLERGVLMHKNTGLFWDWYRKDKKVTDQERYDKFASWVDLCDTFQDMDPEKIISSFDDLKVAKAGASKPKFRPPPRTLGNGATAGSSDIFGNPLLETQHSLDSRLSEGTDKPLLQTAIGKSSTVPETPQPKKSTRNPLPPRPNSKAATKPPEDVPLGNAVGKTKLGSKSVTDGRPKAEFGDKNDDEGLLTSDVIGQIVEDVEDTKSSQDRRAVLL